MAAPPSSRPRRALLTALVAVAALLLLPSVAGASVQYVSVKAKDTGVARDGVLGPGDTVDASVTLTNDDPVHAVANLTATATSSTPGVTVTDGSTVFPAAAAGATVQALDPITVKLSDGWTCGDVVHLTLTLVADGVHSTVDVPVPTGVAGPHDEFRTTAVVSVPDGGTAESGVDVPAGLARDVRVRVRDLQAPAIGDVELTLVPPHGAPVVLLPDHQITGSALSGTLFATNGASILSASAPFTGTYAIPGLAGLVGTEAGGRWKLRVKDTVGGGGAPVLADWSLELAPSTCDAQVVAHLTASPATAAPGQAVTFDASDSTAPDPAATLTYAWKVDGVDVPGATGSQLVRSWPSKGRHRVTVTVSDGDGDATDEADVAVTVPPVPAMAALPSGLRSFDPVTLDASGSSDADGTIATYAWDLDGDGRYDHTDASPTWSTLAPTAGTYTVRLKVTDDLGASAVTTRPLTVGNRPPTAALTGPQPAVRGEAATLDAGGSADLDGTITSYAWTFGDGETATTTTPTASHVYAANGAPTAKVVVTDDRGATAQATLALKVTRRPVAVLAADPLSGRPGDQISLSATGSADPDGGALTYTWSYTGAATCDGAPSTSDHTTVTFLTFGTKKVTVCATDADGAVGIAYATIAIVNDPPVASFTATPDHVLTGQVVTFDASASSDRDGPLAGLRWDLDGDGSYEATGVQASRSYANPGTFTVALLVKDADGATRRTTRQVVVEAAPGSPAAGDDPAGGTGSGGSAPGSGGSAPGSGGAGTGSGGGGAGSGALRPGGTATPAAAFRPLLSGSAIQRVKVVRRRGVGAAVRVDRGARLSLKVTMSARDARRLHLHVRRGARTLTVGTLSRTLRTGRTSLSLKLSRSARRALARARRVPVVVQGTVTDGAGHAARVTRLVLLRR
jgi:PKD repeat protein